MTIRGCDRCDEMDGCKAGICGQEDEGSKPFDGLYVVRAIMGDGPPTVVIRTGDHAIADLMLGQARSFPNHKGSWVDLEDHQGNPHPCLG